MNTPKKIAIAALAAGVASLAVTAQAQAEDRGGWKKMAHGGGWHMSGPRGEMGRHGRRGGRQLMDQFDVNKDGSLTQQEVDQVVQERFAKADAAGNGSVDLEEFKAFWLSESRDGMVRAFQRIDRDGDGAVTKEEYDTLADRMFSRLDRDGNGTLEMVRGGKIGANADDEGPDGDEAGNRRRHARGDDDRGGRRGGHRFGKGGGFGGPGMMFELFDTDKDGKVTRAEFDDVRGQLFASADTDASGSFGLEDFSNIWMTINDQRVVRRFQKLDSNGDLAISAEENAARTSDLVKRLDRNGDGVVTKADMKRGKKGKGGWRHGKRGDGPGEGRGEGKPPFKQKTNG